MNVKQTIRAAERHTLLGAPNKAIQEYQKLLDAGFRDVRVLQALGGLYGQKGDLAQEAHFSAQVRESYRSGGFLLQLEAFYERMLSYSPDRVDVRRELAALQRELGLTSEAEAHERIADSRHAPLPHELASKLQQAELHVKAGRKKEACQELAQVVEGFERHQCTEAWRRAAEQLTRLDWSKQLTYALARH